VIGECIQNISIIGGKVVSATTDGFITNIPNLEESLLNLPLKQIPLFLHFRNLTQDLNDLNSTCLELKHEGKGILS